MPRLQGVMFEFRRELTTISHTLEYFLPNLSLQGIKLKIIVDDQFCCFSLVVLLLNQFNDFISFSSSMLGFLFLSLLLKRKFCVLRAIKQLEKRDVSVMAHRGEVLLCLFRFVIFGGEGNFIYYKTKRISFCSIRQLTFNVEKVDA